MKDKEDLLLLVVILSAVVVLAGAGYLWTFGDGLGNEFVISPTETDGGIQLSPGVCGGSDCLYVSLILCDLLC
jgi:hypothetical protein